MFSVSCAQRMAAGASVGRKISHAAAEALTDGDDGVSSSWRINPLSVVASQLFCDMGAVSQGDAPQSARTLGVLCGDTLSRTT